MLSNFKFKCSYTKPSEPHYFQQSSCPDSQITSLLCSLSTSGTVENLRSCNELSLQAAKTVIFMYCIAGKFGRGTNLANRPWFAKVKPSRLVLTVLLADLFIHQTFFRQRLEKNCFAKLSRYTVSAFILYSGKVWWRESLANLANRSWFAKLKPSRLVLTINNLLADLLIRQTFPLYGNCIKKYSYN